jgi:hypothetical protein
MLNTNWTRKSKAKNKASGGIETPKAKESSVKQKVSNAPEENDP